MPAANIRYRFKLWLGGLLYEWSCILTGRDPVAEAEALLAERDAARDAALMWESRAEELAQSRVAGRGPRVVVI